MAIKANLYLDDRKIEQGGKAPVKLRLYITRTDIRHYHTNIYLTVEQFKESYLAEKPRKAFRELKISLDAIVVKANEIITKMDTVFILEKFERQMFASKASTTNVIEHFEAKKLELENNEQIGTASSYDCSINSIIAFFKQGKKNPVTFLAFSSLTPDVLNKYEKWMVDHNNSKTTVGIYMRNLRHIFNNAIKDGVVHPDLYPFKVYKIPTGKNVKKALENDVLKTLFAAETVPGSHIEKAKDFWFFSYQCNGMNFRDIAELKWKNISDTYFSFLRHKTKNTTKEDPSPIVVPLTDYIKTFIKKYAYKKGAANDYVFPIFQNGMSAKERHRVNQNFIRYINQHMQTLADNLELNINMGTMVARHSFTTKATRAMGLEFAQEALGHTTFMTTQNYWKGFENVAKKELADKLMDFT